MWVLTQCFFGGGFFSQWIQLWHFELVWMIAHERFEGNLRLQVPGKVSSELEPTVTPIWLQEHIVLVRR